MHVHKVYRLNNHRRKQDLFRVNIIPVTTPSMFPENLIFCPTELEITTLASRAPWRPPYSHQSLRLEGSAFLWQYLLRTQHVPGTVWCTVFPLPQLILSLGPQSPSLYFCWSLAIPWSFSISFAGLCSWLDQDCTLFIFVSQSLAWRPVSSRNSINVDEWVNKWMMIAQCLAHHRWSINIG